jgi:hypothetical protein
VKELLSCDTTRLLPVGEIESSDEEHDQLIGVVLAELVDPQRDTVVERAAHIRELLTGYRSGTPDLAGLDEPRAEYHPDRPLLDRYAAKATELDVGATVAST